MVELAAADGGPLKAERIAQAQEIPLKFLENIMADLRQGGLVRSQRGAEGGYWLARPAEEITLAQVIRTVEGPLANVRGRRSEEVEYGGAGAPPPGGGGGLGGGAPAWPPSGGRGAPAPPGAPGAPARPGSPPR